ncbi:hypothetical protein AAEU32_12215 [Pseudoalteromonas sp. SSDWG2]|uniref:hypothetical protein n=1 Tax=Pseudoalteromonas sp. SSDWG2 TaxID=3139391 RepID=UPI003BA9E2C6
MFAILSDYHNLSHAFARLSMLEAIRLKRNLDQVFTDLKMPSTALIEKMREEGLLVDAPIVNKRADNEAAQSIIQSHLGQLFLDYGRLKQALSSLTLAQRVAFKESVDIAVKALNLPSESLTQMMAQEGISIDNLEQDATHTASQQIRARLNTAASEQSTLAQEVKERLNALARAHANSEKEMLSLASSDVVPLRRNQA